MKIYMETDEDRSQNYVSVEISGGLGNQLFQLAMITHYLKTANDKKKSLVLKYEEILPNKYNLPRKTFWSTIFQHQFPLMKEDEFNKIEFNTYFECDPHVFSPPPYNFDRHIFFRGYYQSFKYIDDDVREIMRLYVYNHKNYYNVAEKHYKEVLDHFGNNINLDDIVSVHIRRTDYVMDSDYHYNLGLDYYRQALEITNKKYVVVFSDDIQWCKQNIARNLYQYTNIFFVDIGIVEFEFILMSMFKHNIIANSTFSLWASFISPHRDKLIVAPKNWYSEKGPKEWQEIYHKYITHTI